MTKQLLTLQKLVNRYTLIHRRHYIPGTNTHEDDSSHSLSVAIICWHYLEKLKPGNISAERVLKYALIHDLVEIYAGDVIAYATPKALKQKATDEAKALERLKTELKFEPDLVKHLADYQNHSDTESRFVWACDKMQAYIQGEADNWRPYFDIDVTNEMFINKMNDHLAMTPDVLKAEFERLAKAWIKSFLNRKPSADQSVSYKAQSQSQRANLQ